MIFLSVTEPGMQDENTLGKPDIQRCLLDASQSADTTKMWPLAAPSIREQRMTVPSYTIIKLQPSKRERTRNLSSLPNRLDIENDAHAMGVV